MIEERDTETVSRFTTAPASYDGFGTVTVREAGHDRDLVIREVAIDPEYVGWRGARLY